MVTQSLLWQSQQQSSDFAELCNALYEREIINLANVDYAAVASLQGRIKSLPHYVKRTAFALLNAETPLELDVQNASWSAKQANKLPSISQLSAYDENVIAWYQKQPLVHGLVVPIALNSHIVLDCIDRVDHEQQRFRTNVYGWFNLMDNKTCEHKAQLLKPTKKVMTAACAGHCWQDTRKLQPIMPSLRELLLSCTINWRNFKQPRVNITNN
ncbi:MAG: hypothetical protein ACPG52_00860 [Cognaticolwellia sp.]